MLTKQELELIEQTGIALPVTKIAENRYLTVGNCPFFDGSSCQIYELRPCQCRLYHCGRLKPEEPILETLGQVRRMMIENPDYGRERTKMEIEAITWGNNHGWNWRKDERRPSGISEKLLQQ
jgi:Fe-S-cluster containining protein